MRGLKALLLVAAPLMLAFGLVLPLVRFETFYFFSETPSLLAIVASLWQNGDIPLALIVATVSIVLPILKIVSLATEALGAREERGGSFFFDHVVPQLSRWSMMDVLLVAIVITAAKTTGLATAFTQPGLWFYAASTIISGLLHFLLRKY
ncbi:paraquat-inducible protein A [Rhizobium tubonense]|uniref:Paraquat-inducible membrane protein A n=1 Tax=Rhizobium tubonense TaxID=484088 RepID=A0A2W4CT90_9HYPH|nr:paraquat-inducible protein A [Rhizobium tubonense]PZM14038.1 paraquat-inducible membrane protein A [Rhizobium tubonense]